MDRVKTLLSTFVYPAVLATGFALHAFTTMVAYQLAGPGAPKYLAAFGAWIMPGVAEAVVAYYSWLESGSKVNAYSVWLLVWFVIVLALLLGARFGKRHPRTAAPTPD